MFKLTFNQLMLLSSFVKEKKNYQANDKMVCLCKNPVLVDRFGVCAVCVDGSHHDVTETVWRVGRAVEWCLHGHICEWLTPRWRTSFSRIDSTVGRRRCFVRVNCDTRKQENQSKMHSYLCMAVLLFTVCALSEFSIQSKSPNIYISIRLIIIYLIYFYCRRRRRGRIRLPELQEHPIRASETVRSILSLHRRQGHLTTLSRWFGVR